MADITKIELPDGSKYDIKDSVSGYITAKTTLAGYGITDAKIENGVITLGSNSITPLTSFTETDPVFTASAAYGISSTNITNWNKIYGLFNVTSGSYDGDYWWVLKIPQSGLYQYTNAPGSSGGLRDIYLPHQGSDKNTIIRNNAYDGNSNTLTLPSATGTLALTSQIPTVPTNVSAFTNDAGYLTSYTETDPVFTASAAYGISSSDITNWNGKADTATTLSGYGITDAYISNGTITLGSNSITPLTSAPVTSVNGQTGAVSLTIPTVPTNVSAFTNDAGYLTSETYTGTVTSVQVAATSPVQSSTSTASSTTLSTTISLADGYGDTKNPYGTKMANYVLAGPTSGSAAAPSFRALVAADIPDISATYIPKSIIATTDSTTHTDFANKGTAKAYVPDMRFLSFWNGAYTANGDSNLIYCSRGGIVGSSTTAHISVQTTAPSNPSVGDIWIDTSNL